MTDLNLALQLKKKDYNVVKKNTSQVFIEQLKLAQFTNIINMFRVGTPEPIFPEIEHNGRPTRARSVNENDQHVQGWNISTRICENHNKTFRTNFKMDKS